MDLKAYLNKKGMTQLAFAKSIGISPAELNRFIKGKRTPTLKLAKKIERITQGQVTTDDYYINE